MSCFRTAIRFERWLLGQSSTGYTSARLHKIFHRFLQPNFTQLNSLSSNSVYSGLLGIMGNSNSSVAETSFDKNVFFRTENGAVTIRGIKMVALRYCGVDLLPEMMRYSGGSSTFLSGHHCRGEISQNDIALKDGVITIDGKYERLVVNGIDYSHLLHLGRSDVARWAHSHPFLVATFVVIMLWWFWRGFA